MPASIGVQDLDSPERFAQAKGGLASAEFRRDAPRLSAFVEPELPWRRRLPRGASFPDDFFVSESAFLFPNYKIDNTFQADNVFNMNELLNIAAGLYPDENPPDDLAAIEDRVDFLSRLCAAWDFGILPDERVIEAITRADWRAAVDACGLLTSPAYHLLREWQGLPPQPFLGQASPEIVNDPNLAHV